MYQKYGNAYSWSECARAQIYRRDQNKAQNLQLFQDIQRYNHWQIDPLSLHDACRGIRLFFYSFFCFFFSSN